MRWIVSITATLLAIGLLGIYVAGPPDPPAHPMPSERWVRTADGWEQPGWWQRLEPQYQATLHPLVVALLEFLLSLIALLVFPVPARTSRPGRSTPRGPPCGAGQT